MLSKVANRPLNRLRSCQSLTIQARFCQISRELRTFIAMCQKGPHFIIDLVPTQPPVLNGTYWQLYRRRIGVGVASEKTKRDQLDTCKLSAFPGGSARHHLQFISSDLFLL